jgi:hypothetical protein
MAIITRMRLTALYTGSIQRKQENATPSTLAIPERIVHAPMSSLPILPYAVFCISSTAEASSDGMSHCAS